MDPRFGWPLKRSARICFRPEPDAATRVPSVSNQIQWAGGRAQVTDLGPGAATEKIPTRNVFAGDQRPRKRFRRPEKFSPRKFAALFTSIFSTFLDAAATRAHAKSSRLGKRASSGDRPKGGGGSGSRGRACNPHSGDLRALGPHKCRKAAVERRRANGPIARAVGRSNVPNACFAARTIRAFSALRSF